VTPRSVLLVHELFPPDFRGGGERVALRTATALMARGIGVEVLTTGDPAITSFEGVPTRRLRIPRQAMALHVGTIARAAARHDLVHAFNYYAALPALVAARLARRPVVCGMLGLFGDGWLRLKGGLRGRAYMMLERRILRAGFDRMVFLSEPSRQAGIAAGAHASRSLVLHPGIEDGGVPPAERREDVVLFAGRLDARKGYPHLVAAARALPHVRFLAYGWAPDIAALRAAAPPNLEVREGQSGDVYWRLLSQARIFVFPTYAETFGLVVAEAMAGGCAVVSSLDTIPFAGHRHAPGDESAMIAALARLWDDPAACAAAGVENMRRAAAYTWETHAGKLVALYADVLGARRGAVAEEV
jgi:glycosyltransferase involved in cell wall biosynthesis